MYRNFHNSVEPPYVKISKYLRIVTVIDAHPRAMPTD